MSDFSEGKFLIFIGGAPRSGTTMIQKMMDAHPDVAGGPEFDNVPDIVKLRDRLHRSVDRGRIDLFCTKTEIDCSIGKFLEDLLLPYAFKDNAKYLSEKTPSNVLVMKKLIDIFPKAKFLFCVRDPRAVVSSMLQVGARAKGKNIKTGFFTRNIFGAMAYVKACNDAGFESLKFSDRVYLVHYEKMVSNPATELKKLCSFIGIPWEEAMIVANPEGKVSVDDIWCTKEMLSSVPDSSRKEKWRQNLSKIQLFLIENYFKYDQNLKKLGYVFPKGTSLNIHKPMGLFLEIFYKVLYKRKIKKYLAR